MTDTSNPSSQDRVAALVRLLEVERLGDDQFRGRRKQGGVGRIFGGQVIAQALAAAEQTAPPGRAPHSLHAYFLRGGDEDHPIDFRVERDFDGRSFANRRVVASQQGKPILNLAASFHVHEDGKHHQWDMGDYPAPEDLPSESDFAAQVHQITGKFPLMVFRGPLEFRIDPAAMPNTPQHNRSRSFAWLRTVAPLPDDPAIHRAVIAYMSDLTLAGTSLMAHDLRFWQGTRTKGASLDHAIWFHEPARADEWLLYTTDSPWSGHSRGFNRGMFYTRDGRLAASTAQENLFRVTPTAQPEG